MPNTPRGMALFIPVILQRKEIKGSARMMNVKTTDDSAFRIYLNEALSVDLIATSIILECLALLLQNFERNSTSKTVPFTARLLSDELFERTKPSDPFLCRFLHESIALLKQHAWMNFIKCVLKTVAVVKHLPSRWEIFQEEPFRVLHFAKKKPSGHRTGFPMGHTLEACKCSEPNIG